MPAIRSITYFSDVFADDYETPFEQAGTFLTAAKTAFTAANIMVQTTRMATQPFPQGVVPDGADSVEMAAQSLSARCELNEIDYLSIGCVSAKDDLAYIAALADVFAATPNIFGTVEIASAEHGISFEVLHHTAKLIKAVSELQDDGMANLFLAALANCPPYSPFFPVAYHGGGDPAFALAIQAADLAVRAFATAKTPQQAQDNLIHEIEHYAAKLVPIATQLAQNYNVQFKGLDFSLAPYPTDDKSLGGAIEALGTPFGSHGLVAAASLIMNAIEAADFPSVGFSGLMLPVLEDSVLGARASEEHLTLQDLLLLSTVCGTGLDCIPLAGAISTEHLAAILMDVAALSLRLDKPLTARLMPFPNKQVGDPVTFGFEFFADSRIMPTPAKTLKTNSILGATQGTLKVRPRK